VILIPLTPTRGEGRNTGEPSKLASIFMAKMMCLDVGLNGA
jgi:hypothetical protein